MSRGITPTTAAATAVEGAVQFASDGFMIPGFLARPSGAAAPAKAVLVLHEWWGLNDQIRGVARRFAAAGYVALAPDGYARQGSRVAQTPPEATTLMNAVSAQRILRDLNAAAQFLKAQPAVDPIGVGIVGFGMGGTFALTQAAHNSDLRAAVIFYGKVPPVESLDALVCPVLFHAAGQDIWVTPQEVERLRQAGVEQGKAISVQRYPDADHGFFNERRPEVYRALDAERAWQRTLAFLGQHVGS